jgi:shikimate kinase
MILSINGWPGVGKRTVGVELADRLGGRLLDNHTFINVAKALTDYGEPGYYEAIRRVRDIAFEILLTLPPHIPVVLTNVLATNGPTDFAEEHWKAIRLLAAKRGSSLLSITLDCDSVEHAQRMSGAERRALKKMTNPADLAELREKRSLFDDGADYRILIDNSDLTPTACATQIIEWVQVLPKVTHDR